jgi:hypothetical protein
MKEAAMSLKTYYRRALLLPVVLPFLVYPLLLLSDGVASIAIMLQYSLVIGGVPYLLFAGGFLLWMRGRTEREVHVGILLSPLVYALVMMACLAAFLGADGKFQSGLEMFGIAGGFSLLFGYGYVALAEAGRVLLRPGGAPPEPAPDV